LIKRIDDLAIDVELQLLDCGVSDADRLGVFEAAKPGNSDTPPPVQPEPEVK
jgi:hypothetical protein